MSPNAACCSEFQYSTDPRWRWERVSGTACRLKQVWSASDGLNGAIMRHPPEKYYPMVDGSYDWIKGQILDFMETTEPPGTRALTRIESAALRGAPVTTREERRYAFKALVADGQTEGEIANGIKPSYQIVAVDKHTGKLELMKTPDGRSRVRFDDTDPKAASERRILMTLAVPQEPWVLY